MLDDEEENSHKIADGLLDGGNFTTHQPTSAPSPMLVHEAENKQDHETIDGLLDGGNFTTHQPTSAPSPMLDEVENKPHYETIDKLLDEWQRYHSSTDFCTFSHA